MELNDFKARLKSGSLGGCYLFAGEEDYLKKHYLGALRSAAVTDEGLAPFNHLVFDGGTVDFAALTDGIKAPPFMSDYKLIEWRYASFEKMKESELVLLEQILDLVEENDWAVVAFLVADGEVDLGTPKKESKFTKRFGKRMGILNFPKSTDVQLLSWLKKHFDHNGIGVSADTLRALIFRSGHSMTALAEEVEKLSAYAKANGLAEIGIGEVEAVASSTPESDTFALSNAIIDRNKKAALAALDEMKGRRIDPVIVTAMMARTYTDIVNVTSMLADGMGAKDIELALKMNPYKLKNYIAAAKKHPADRSLRVLTELCRMDTSSKFGGIAGYTAIELFITKCI